MEWIWIWRDTRLSTSTLRYTPVLPQFDRPYDLKQALWELNFSGLSCNIFILSTWLISRACSLIACERSIFYPSDMAFISWSFVSVVACPRVVLHVCHTRSHNSYFCLFQKTPDILQPLPPATCMWTTPTRKAASNCITMCWCASHYFTNFNFARGGDLKPQAHQK